jgi:ankyrin repeat protein
MVLFGAVASAQEPAKVDFARDVQPLFQQHCVSCHGPSQQIGGLRLDRRRDALRGGTLGAVIVPGNSDRSRIYGKLIGKDFGAPMPPAGALPGEQVEIIKAWIDQGAEWPDAAAGENAVSLPDRNATRMMRAIRAQDWREFQRLLAKYPEAITRKGTGGSTPLMYAALYGDLPSVRLLLQAGAEPNVVNDSGATALMWAVDDLRKTRLLLDHGADVNARSNDGRTPLMIAANRAGSSPVLELLLARGAKPNVVAPSLFGPATPLSQAAYAGDADAIELLIRSGADVKKAGPLPLALANQARCAKCVGLLAAQADVPALTGAMILSGPPLGDATQFTFFLNRGAVPTATDMAGHSLLMLAAASEDAPVESVKALLERGADVNAKSPAGDTALALAKRHGRTPVVDLLEQASAAKSAEPMAPPPLMPSHAATPQEAVAKSLPLLQRTGGVFLEKSGCVSCHNNTLLMMSVSAARASRIPVDEAAERAQVAKIGAFIETWRDRALQGIGIPGDADTISYILHGLAAERYAPDAATDAMAHFIKSRQLADGRWAILAHRPPIESSDIEVTAASIRSLRAYAPPSHRDEYEKAAARGGAWLVTALARTNEELAFKLLGLSWSGMKRDAIQAAARDLVSRQQPDGGWAQLPSMNSDAYATGQALVALSESGALDVNDPAYRRGVKFLLDSQLEDGSWYVRTRAMPLQRQFDIGFPHGLDSWISSAATNWATTALAYAIPAKGSRSNH